MVHNFERIIKGYSYVPRDAQQGGSGDPNPWDVIKNSSTFLLRMALGMPDGLSMGVNVDGVVGGGVDATPISKLVVLTGHDRGKSKIIGDAGFGVGFNNGVAFSVTEYYYFDPTGKRPMEIGDFKGLRFSAGVDYNILGPLEAGIGISIAPIVPSQSIYMIGLTRQYGVSPPSSMPASGDVNFGWTWFYK